MGRTARRLFRSFSSTECSELDWPRKKERGPYPDPASPNYWPYRAIPNPLLQKHYANLRRVSKDSAESPTNPS